MKRDGSGCYRCSVSSIEQAAIPVPLGTCQSWSRPAVLDIMTGIQYRARDLEKCPARREPPVTFMRVESPV